MRCPICDFAPRIWGEIEGTPVLQCKSDSCGFIFLDLTRWKPQYPETDYYEDWQPGQINPTAPWIAARVDLVRKFKRGGAVAELGCGVGETALGLAEAGFSVVGVEESPKAVNFLRDHYPIVQWVNAGITEFLSREKTLFDSITMFHVLEHIPHPESIIRLVDRALHADGVLVIEVPDVSGGFARLKGKRWEYFINHHVNYFDVRSLTNLMRLFGFRRRYVEKTYHFSYPQGHRLKDVIKGTLAKLGLNSIIRTVWTR